MSNNSIALLLADPSPCLRRLVLRELLNRPVEDMEVMELDQLCQEDDLVTDLFKLQRVDGSWKAGDLPGTTPRSRLLTTAQGLMRLGYLGFGIENPVVKLAVDYIFSLQNEDGSWPLNDDDQDESREGYTMMPMQTALPLRGLLMVGCAQDVRCEKAFNWLFEQRLEDGAWPVGINSGTYGYIAGYRRLGHSRWGCRSHTTGVLTCLALYPSLCHGSGAKRALDLLLGRETREAYAVGFEVARLIGAEETRGFTTYFARFDLAQILDLCWHIGATLEDERVADLVRFVKERQGPYGIWEYTRMPQASRWVTFDLLRSLSRLDQGTDWISLEPRTPFKPYLKKERRY